jgi:CRP/FNR family transcriptional regulator, anaerobic regulatory protein
MADFLKKTAFEECRKNECLVRAGAVCDRVWFVHRGILRHYLTHGAREGTVWFSFPGDLMTDTHSFIQRSTAVHNIIAVTDCALLSMSYADLQHFYDTEKVWERFGRLTTALYLFKQMERSNDLLFKTGKEKYDAFIAAHPEALQHIPLNQIADFIGVQFETLSRIRNKRN